MSIELGTAIQGSGRSGRGRSNSWRLAPFVAVAMLGLVGPSSNAAILYSASGFFDTLIRIDTTAGTTTSIPLTSGGSSFDYTGSLSSLDFAPDGQLYLGDRQASPFTLSTIDVNTGEVTGIPSNFPSFDAENLVFSPSGTLFAAQTMPVNTIDLLASPVTLLATGANFGVDIDAIERTDSGVFFHLNVIGSDTEFYSRTSLNGVSTLLATHPGEFFSLALSDGVLFSLARDGSLYEVNQTTAALTFVQDVGVFGLQTLAAPVPEPSSLLLLAAGVLVAIGVRFRATET